MNQQLGTPKIIDNSDNCHAAVRISNLHIRRALLATAEENGWLSPILAHTHNDPENYQYFFLRTDGEWLTYGFCSEGSVTETHSTKVTVDEILDWMRRRNEIIVDGFKFDIQPKNGYLNVRWGTNHLCFARAGRSEILRFLLEHEDI